MSLAPAAESPNAPLGGCWLSARPFRDACYFRSAMHLVRRRLVLWQLPLRALSLFLHCKTGFQSAPGPRRSWGIVWVPLGLCPAGAARPIGEPMFLAVGGAEGDRTPDPRLAKPMLSQLSYSPGCLYPLVWLPLRALRLREAWTVARWRWAWSELN